MRDFKPITVRDLREILKQFPDDMMVVTEGRDSGFEQILHPEVIKVRHKPENMEYDGEYQVRHDDDRDTLEVLAILRNLRSN
jgi:hypothetical protein